MQSAILILLSIFIISMKQNEVLYGIIGILAGVVFTMLFIFKTGDYNHGRMMGMMGIRSSDFNQKSAAGKTMMDDDDSMSMNGMVSALKDKTGDEFDKAFVTLMIEHHQGAVDMASLVEKQAKHKEVKDLAKAIITTQTKEIDMMKSWLKEWGY